MCRLPASQSGFSMFELVAFIIVVAIIYATAANRFGEFPGEAERANFLATTTQLQAAVNLELMLAMTSGQKGMLNSYEDANPMDILLDPPSNYVGAFDFVDLSRMPRRVWYFDSQRNQLVYLVNDAEDVYLVYGSSRVPTEEIRFELNVVYRDGTIGISNDQENNQTAQASNSEIQNRSRRVSGLLLKPVVPYLWSPSEEDLMLLAQQAS
jgi:type II secretory pathway pseudopilin PulG